MCNSARGMMVALGCVQSLECNTNKCPTGIATQDPDLARGLVVPTKAERVAKYHKATVNSVLEIIASAGLRNTTDLNRSHLFRRISETEVRRFDEIYPSPVPGSFLDEKTPSKFAQALTESCAQSFNPKHFVAETDEGLKEVS